MAAIVLAIVSTTAVLPFLAGLQQINEAARLHQATALGHAIMEEVLARSFYEPGEREPSPGPEDGEDSRAVYDNIDDFAGFSEEVTGLHDYLGETILDPAAEGFWREVSVDYVRCDGSGSLPDLGQQALDEDSLIHIQVRVYQREALLVTLDRIVSRED